MALAFARKVGKVSIVPPWIKMPYNAYQIVRVTENLTLIPSHALVRKSGAETIAPKNSVIWIVANMAVVLVMHVHAMMAGVEIIVIPNCAIPVVMNMVNVKMVLAFV